MASKTKTERGAAVPGPGAPHEWLLDVNLLIALTHRNHVHHAVAHAWFGAVPDRHWATCSLTQLGFIRIASHPRLQPAPGTGIGTTPRAAIALLDTLARHPGHRYWPDAPEPRTLPTLATPALVGHRQVTDAWLLGLAQRRGQALATLDRGLAACAHAIGMGRQVELVAAPGSMQESPARCSARGRRASGA